MRALFLAAAIGLATLASCGPPATQTEEAAPPEPAAPAGPVRSYAATEFSALNGGTVTPGSEGVQITTDPRTGAMSASLALGPEAATEGLVLRVRARVDDGAFSLVMTHANWPEGYAPYASGVFPGDVVTVDLPIDRTGEPLLIVGNGRETNQASTGVILSVELVRADS